MEIELSQGPLSRLMKFFDFDRLQADPERKNPTHRIGDDFLDDYLENNPDARAELPDDVKKMLRLDELKLESVLEALKYESDSRPWTIANPGAKATPGRTQLILTGKDTAAPVPPVSEAGFKIDGSTGLVIPERMDGIELTESEKRKRDWDLLHKRWKALDLRTKSRAVRWENLSPEKKAQTLYLNMDLAHLKPTVSPEDAELFNRLKWHRDGRAWEFNHKGTLRDPNQFLDDVGNVGKKAGVASKLLEPSPDHFKDVVLHYHISVAGRDLSPLIELFNDRALLKRVKAGILNDLTYRGGYIYREDVSMKGLVRQVDPSHFEVRSHVGSLRQELGFYLRHLNMPNEEALASLRAEISSLLTPEVIERFTAHNPNLLLRRFRSFLPKSSFEPQGALYRSIEQRIRNFHANWDGDPRSYDWNLALQALEHGDQKLIQSLRMDRLAGTQVIMSRADRILATSKDPMAVAEALSSLRVDADGYKRLFETLVSEQRPNYRNAAARILENSNMRIPGIIEYRLAGLLAAPAELDPELVKSVFKLESDWGYWHSLASRLDSDEGERVAKRVLIGHSKFGHDFGRELSPYETKEAARLILELERADRGESDARARLNRKYEGTSSRIRKFWDKQRQARLAQFHGNLGDARRFTELHSRIERFREGGRNGNPAYYWDLAREVWQLNDPSLIRNLPNPPSAPSWTLIDELPKILAASVDPVQILTTLTTVELPSESKNKLFDLLFHSDFVTRSQIARTFSGRWDGLPKEVAPALIKMLKSPSGLSEVQSDVLGYVKWSDGLWAEIFKALKEDRDGTMLSNLAPFIQTDSLVTVDQYPIDKKTFARLSLSIKKGVMMANRDIPVDPEIAGELIDRLPAEIDVFYRSQWDSIRKKLMDSPLDIGWAPDAMAWFNKRVRDVHAIFPSAIDDYISPIASRLTSNELQTLKENIARALVELKSFSKDEGMRALNWEDNLKIASRLCAELKSPKKDSLCNDVKIALRRMLKLHPHVDRQAFSILMEAAADNPLLEEALKVPEFRAQLPDAVEQWAMRMHDPSREKPVSGSANAVRVLAALEGSAERDKAEQYLIYDVFTRNRDQKNWVSDWERVRGSVRSSKTEGMLLGLFSRNTGSLVRDEFDPAVYRMMEYLLGRVIDQLPSEALTEELLYSTRFIKQSPQRDRLVDRLSSTSRLQKLDMAPNDWLTLMVKVDAKLPQMGSLQREWILRGYQDCLVGGCLLNRPTHDLLTFLDRQRKLDPQLLQDLRRIALDLDVPEWDMKKIESWVLDKSQALMTNPQESAIAKVCGRRYWKLAPRR